MQIKTVLAQTTTSLDKDVNEYLNCLKQQGLTLKDIKFSTFLDDKNDFFVFGAMIIFF
jgi:hypothetical protein